MLAGSIAGSIAAGPPASRSGLAAGASSSSASVHSAGALFIGAAHALQGRVRGGRPSLLTFSSRSEPFTQSQHVAPGAPGDLMATAGSSQVSLSWTAPASDGDSALIGYEIYEGTRSGGELVKPVGSTGPLTTSYTVTSLINGTTYYFVVKAVNDTAGAGPASNEASATPGAQTIKFAQPAAQPVGATFTVSATASSGQPVTFSTDTPSVCTVTGSTVTTVAPGTCTITASQAGNANYAAASVVQSFQVQLAGHHTAARTLLIIVLAAAVILATTAALLALLVLRRRRVRSRSRARPEPSVRAVPDPGPPASVSVHATGTGATHTVRIEPTPGASITTIQETLP